MVVELNETNTRDIWSTSVFSYTGQGNQAGGGGAEDERLRVGGWGDEYVSLIQPPLVTRLFVQPRKVLLSFYSASGEGQPTPMHVEAIRQTWAWKKGDRLWWKDVPSSQRLFTAPAPGTDQRVTIDITDLYLSWLRKPEEAYGLLLRPVLTNNNFNEFGSTRAALAERRPQLIISY